MTEVAQSYEIVRNFNNLKAFVMFAVKKLETLLILVQKFRICLYMLVTGKMFFTMLMLVRKIFLTSLIFGKNLHDLVKILGNVGQTMTTPPPPPPPMLVASRRPCADVR